MRARETLDFPLLIYWTPALRLNVTTEDDFEKSRLSPVRVRELVNCPRATRSPLYACSSLSSIAYTLPIRTHKHFFFLQPSRHPPVQLSHPHPPLLPEHRRLQGVSGQRGQGRAGQPQPGRARAKSLRSVRDKRRGQKTARTQGEKNPALLINADVSSNRLSLVHPHVKLACQCRGKGVKLTRRTNGSSWPPGDDRHVERRQSILTISSFFQTALCPKLPLICKFCGEDHPASEMSSHEGECGARCRQCDRCGGWVRMKEWDRHLSQRHGMILAQRSPARQRRENRSPSKEKDKMKATTEASKAATTTTTKDAATMIPCEFCEGLVPIYKLLEHQVRTNFAFHVKMGLIRSYPPPSG